MIARWLTRFSCLLFLLFTGGLHAQSKEPLTIGVIPYLTPNVLMSLFQPLREHLEKELGRPAELYTSPDVRTFAKRTLRPDFDLIITAAHQARLAQVEAGYYPVARFTGPLHAAMVVGTSSPAKELKELRGKTIAITDRSILVNIAMATTLNSLGITDKDIKYLPVNSQNSGLLAVARGDADAAVIAHFTLDQSPEEQRKAVRVLYKSDVLPNVTLLVKPTLPADERTAIQRALLALPNQPAGAIFLEKSRFQGLQATDEASMKRLDAYLPETRHQLGL